MVEFDSFQSRDKFRTHESINSWFSSLSPWTAHFEVLHRIVWIDVEDIPLRAWSKTTFNKIARKWGELVFMDDSNSANKYSKVYVVRAKEVTGWVPDFREENSDESEDYSDNNSVGKKNCVESKKAYFEAFKSPPGDPFGLEDLTRKLAKKGNKVAHEMNDSNLKFPPGFTPQHSDHYEYEKVEALRESTTPQDLKKENEMVSLDVFVVKNLWGNILFDFATSLARGRLGGTWMANNADLLFISVYSPQELSLKRVLWNYMLETLNRWHGEVIIMGDFNEVRFASERHGSYFYSLNAAEFNMFIANSQLIDIPLGGLILHLHLSDHRPILLKETHVDYGHIPFRLYHSWFLEDDFHCVIEDSCNNDGIYAINSMILLKNKLNFLKQRLKEWSSIKRKNKDYDRKVIQDSLIEIDLRLDKGNSLPDDLTKRANLFRYLKDIDHKDSVDLAQKEKIKWAVEGDENSKFFHGIVNNKRRHLAIKVFNLEDMVSSEEIKRAVWDCGSDKSPGPDGFIFDFLRNFGLFLVVT
uniref:RNA-directed DNA polymerase, eukaryota n=1 Tax=Tanacetum cinerariifolium TaxID=118510 RepID=A0A699K3J3_TANCI|nr:hypothetical protein [Tanacetum cinerariifolium]